MKEQYFNIGNLICIFVMFFATVVAIFIPLMIMKCYRKVENEATKIRYGSVLSSLNMYNGGVFLGLALLDLLPDVLEDISDILNHSNTQFPVGEFLVGIGLLLMMILDQILLLFHETQVDNTDPIARLSRQEPAVVTHLSNLHVLPEIPTVPKPTVFHAFVLFLSLAFHSLFEGLVITTQGTDYTSLLAIFTPILLHKVLVAFGLGFNSVQTEMSTISFVLIGLFFSSMTPTGMLLGLSLGYFLPMYTLKWVSTAVEGVACGTFLYVVCFELLPLELGQGRFRLLKVAMIIAGYSSMSLFIYLIHHY